MKSTLLADHGMRSKLMQPQLDPSVDKLLSIPAAWGPATLHIYNDDYLGIRSSASALPGRKLVLPNQSWDFRRHVRTAATLAVSSGASHVVFHGMSNAVFESALAIHRMNPRLRLFGVWHGGPSQWVDVREASELSRFLQLDKEVFTKSHIMKPGCNGVLTKPSQVALINCPPRQLHAPKPPRSRAALVPGTPSMHKNLWGNLLAAEFSSKVDEVRHYAALTGMPMSLKKTKQVSYLGPKDHQRQLRDVAVVLNASTMDCHPMVDLEAASAGRPSLHMNLHLEAIPDHPLERVTTVEDSASIDSILETLEKCLSLDSVELLDMCLDYADQMRTISLARWQQFLFEEVG